MICKKKHSEKILWGKQLKLKVECYAYLTLLEIRKYIDLQKKMIQNTTLYKKHMKSSLKSLV